MATPDPTSSNPSSSNNPSSGNDDVARQKSAAEAGTESLKTSTADEPRKDSKEQSPLRSDPEEGQETLGEFAGFIMDRSRQ
ncbi:hypothetical protein ACKKBG_A36580 [Auxenochlorella protothecoides x Auxenochlorella symbiontica]